METVEVEGRGSAAVAPRTRSHARGWVLPLAPWVVALVLGATLIWIVPRASASRTATARDASLSATVATARSAEGSASASLAATQAQLSDATQRVAALKAAAHRRAADITRLQAQAKKLRAERVRLTAPSSSAGSYPPFHINPPCVPVPTEGGGHTTLCL